MVAQHELLLDQDRSFSVFLPEKLSEAGDEESRRALDFEAADALGQFFLLDHVLLVVSDELLIFLGRPLRTE